MYMQSGSNDATSDAEVLARLTSGRFTCRAYQTTPVPNDVIESIVEIARKTASWCNVQPWHLLITSAETTQSFRDALVEHATHASGIDSDIPFPEEYRGDFAERRREAGYRLYEALGIGRSDKDRRVAQGFENFRMFGAPHVAIVTIPAELVLTPASIAVRSSVRSCCGTCSRCRYYAAGALAQHARLVRSYFGIGDDRKMVCGIAFGYAKPDHPVNGFRTSCIPLDEVMRIV